MLERGRAMHKAWSADSVQLQPASRHVPTRAVEQLPSRKTSAFAEPWFSYPTITGTRILLGVCVLWGIWTLCMLMARPDHQRVYGHAPSAASGDSVGLQEGAREQRNLFQEQQQHWRQRYKTRSKGIQVHPRAPTGLSPGSSSQPWEMISQPQVEASKDDSQVKVAKPMPLQQNWLKMSLNQPLTRIIGKAESPKPKELAKSKGVPATVESTSGLSGREKTKPDKTTGPPGTPAATAPLNTTEYVEKVIPTLPKRPVTCIAWRQTSGCDPNGPREPDNDRACNSKIEHGASGYCEFLDRRASPDGEVKRAMLMHCNSHPQTFITKGVLTCGQISEFVNFAPESLTFRSKDGPAVQTQLAQLPETRGIVFCVADGLMISTYAVVRILRQLGCTLPFELWYLPDELTQSSKAIVGELVYRYGAQMRPIPVDRTKLCHGGGKDKCFSVKIYAVYHSK